MWYEEWQNVLFIDKKIFNLNGTDELQHVCWGLLFVKFWFL